MAIIVYFNSSFLVHRGFSDGEISLLYIVGSIASLLLLFAAPYILRALGNYKTVLASVLILILLLTALASFFSLTTIVAAFVVLFAVQTLLFFCFDIFLEHYTPTESGTGDVRGITVTTYHIAFVLAPVTAGILLELFGFGGLYVLSAIALVPFGLLIAYFFRKFKDKEYHTLSLKSALRTIRRRASIRRIFVIQVLLRLFYALMVIYTPLYLLDLGFSPTQIGVMFSVMLVPFVMLAYPLGHYADKRWGEKELLIGGFLIMALATSTIAFIDSSQFFLWMAILFATRIGAAIVEIMNEIYFFKHIKEDDTDTLSMFRMLRPVGYILAPFLGIIVLYIADMRFIFFFLSLFLLTGVYVSTMLRDTK